MPEVFDPWAAATPGRTVGERKKSLRLAGNGAGKVHTLVKAHNWRGRAIYVYHLLKGEHKRVNKPSDELWEQFASAGVPIAYPPQDHESSDTDFWVKYAKQQASALGLKVAE